MHHNAFGIVTYKDPSHAGTLLQNLWILQIVLFEDNDKVAAAPVDSVESTK